MNQKTIYRQGIAPTLEGVRSRLGPKVLDRLKSEAGYDDARAASGYPVSAFDKVVGILCEELYPGVALEQAMFELGGSAMRRYGESALGRAVIPVVRFLGPMRFLKRVPHLFRQTNNYAELSVDVTGPTRFEFTHNEVGAVPHYYRGVMGVAGVVVGLKDYHCELMTYDGHQARYRVEWHS